MIDVLRGLSGISVMARLVETEFVRVHVAPWHLEGGADGGV